MENLYFIIRAGLVLAILAGIAFSVGMFIGRHLWLKGDEGAEEIEEENRRLREEYDSLRDPVMKSSIPRV